MNIKITYETLFEILRREKSRDELQKLDDNFFQDIIDYIKEKENMISRQKSSPDLFSFEEERKKNNQIDNIRKIVKELYERREKKIINIALNKSRTKSSIIDTSSLLPEEKEMFEDIINSLNRYRSSILNSMLSLSAGFSEPMINSEWGKEEEKKDIIKADQTENIKEKEAIKNKIVRFLHPVPRFLGKELETYGPFEAEEIAALPEEIANVLIEKHRAEEIKSE